MSVLSHPSDNQQGTFLGALPACLSAYLCNMILPPWLNAVLFCSPPSGTHQDMEKGTLVRNKETPPQERKHVVCSNQGFPNYILSFISCLPDDPKFNLEPIIKFSNSIYSFLYYSAIFLSFNLKFKHEPSVFLKPLEVQYFYDELFYLLVFYLLLIVYEYYYYCVCTCMCIHTYTPRIHVADQE